MPKSTPNHVNADRPSTIKATSSTNSTGVSCGLQPSSSPMPMMMVMPRICSIICPMTWAVMTDRRVTGKERNRSMTPLVKSVAVATPAPMTPNARPWPTSPGSR